MIEHSRNFRRIKKICDWDINISQACYYLIEVIHGQDAGVWGFHPHKDGFMFHANISKECRGKSAVESAKSAFNWIFGETKTKIIYACVPADKLNIRMFARVCGFELEHKTDEFNFYSLKAI